VPSTVIVGAQWGDEGKGRIVDIIAAESDLTVRFQGGNNAGHTVIVGEEIFALHLIPSGIIRGLACVIGNGLVVDLGALLEEKQTLESKGIAVDGKLILSDHCHLILPYHKLLDEAEESRRGARRIGTTKRGIGPAYTDKYARRGIRLGELCYPADFRAHLEHNLAEKNELLQKIYGLKPLVLDKVYDDIMAQFEQVKPMVTDTSLLVNQALAAGKKILFEGSQGALLDIDFGTYPYATSSNPIAGAVCTGIGLGPKKLDRIIGVIKAYTTRVGDGPFPTQCEEALAAKFRTIGREFGTTTGRPRRIGWFDVPVVKKAARLNGLDEIALTHLDVLDQFDRIPVCVAYERQGEKITDFPNLVSALADCKPVYEELPGWRQDTTGARRWEDLPLPAREYVLYLEKLLQTRVSMILVGPSREQYILR